MDYEKAYKDAVRKIKSIIADKKKQGLTNCLFEGDLNEIFPELNESEDEKIWKTLREIIIDYDPNNEILIKEVGISQKQFLAWLEKQGEQNSIPKFKVGDWIVFNNNHYSVYQEEPAFTIDDFKPFDKVLVRGIFGWKIELFAIYHKGWDTPYECLGGSYDKCVPYNEETKCLLSTFIEYNGKYKTW